MKGDMNIDILIDNHLMPLAPEAEECPAGFDIVTECCEIANMLLDKNRKYGNSALNPVRVFSKADAVEQIRVRLDDKISRLQSAQADEDEDVINDLIGYLVLLRIALKNRDQK